MKRALDTLDPSEWVLIGYVIGVLVIVTVETFGGSSDSSPARRSEQRVVLGEDHLRRIEDGDPLRVERWHGHDLVLDGTMIIDAEQVEDADAGGDTDT